MSLHSQDFRGWKHCYLLVAWYLTGYSVFHFYLVFHFRGFDTAVTSSIFQSRTSVISSVHFSYQMFNLSSSAYREWEFHQMKKDQTQISHESNMQVLISPYLKMENKISCFPFSRFWYGCHKFHFSVSYVSHFICSFFISNVQLVKQCISRMGISSNEKGSNSNQSRIKHAGFD